VRHRFSCGCHNVVGMLQPASGLHLVGKGIRRTRVSERLSGGLSPPKMAAALAPDACKELPALATRYLIQLHTPHEA
jgi:hypothetical protein